MDIPKSKRCKTSAGDADQSENQQAVHLSPTAANVNPQSKVQPDITPLMSAIVDGDYKLVKKLIAAGVPINTQNPEGFSPLAMAAICGHNDVGKLLLDAKATIDSIHPELLEVTAYVRSSISPMELLTRFCTSFKRRDPVGLVVMQRALSLGNTMLTKALLFAKAPLNFGFAQEDNASPLHLAASKGHTSVVNVLLDARADVNALDKSHVTPLLAAVKNKHIAAAEKLVAAGASLLSRTKDGNTPLMLASEAGDVSMVRLLLSRGKEGLNAENADSMSALALAVKKNRVEAAKMLIEARASLCESPTKRSILSIAVEAHSLEMTRLLLDSKANPDIFSEECTPPLVSASANGDIEIVKQLLEARADPAVERDEGMYPLCCALLNDNTEVAKVLIAAGANLNVRSLDFATPLILAVMQDNAEAVDELIKAGSTINACNFIGLSALSLAAGAGNIAIMKSLIRAKADLEIRDTGCETPLMNAAKNSQLLAVTELLSAGARIDSRDQRGNCVLSHAASADVAEALIAAGADVHARDQYGCTPLMRVASEGFGGSVAALLKAGARVNDADYSDMTALHMSMLKSLKKTFDDDVIKALLVAKADVCALTAKNESIIHFATRNPDMTVPILDTLLKAGAPLNGKNWEGNTATMLAAVDSKSTDKLKLFISHGADLTVRDHTGRTALILAVEKLNIRAVEMLLDAGAEWQSSHQTEMDALFSLIRSVPSRDDKDILNIRPLTSPATIILERLIDAKVSVHNQQYYAPIVAAAAKPAALKVLLKAGVDVNARARNGETPLIAAVSAGALESVDALLEAKADVNMMDYDNDTPLKLAVETDNVKIATSLIAAGAQIELGYSAKDTPLATALGHATAAMLHVLIQAKADVNRLTRYDSAPLVEALSKKKLIAIQLLVKAGMDLSDPEISANTVYVAVERGYGSILRILLEGKADVNAKNRYGTRRHPLMVALTAKNVNMDVVSLLLDAGAKVEDCVSDEGTLLGSPHVQRNPELLKRLLRILSQQTGYPAHLEDQ